MGWSYNRYGNGTIKTVEARIIIPLLSALQWLTYDILLYLFKVQIHIIFIQNHHFLWHIFVSWYIMLLGTGLLSYLDQGLGCNSNAGPVQSGNHMYSTKLYKYTYGVRESRTQKIFQLVLQSATKISTRSKSQKYVDTVLLSQYQDRVGLYLF